MIIQAENKLEKKKKEPKERIKKDRVKGFAKTISSALNTAQKLNEAKVKEIIKGVRSRIIFNPKDGDWAALITIENDNIDVKGIDNTSKEVFKRKYLLWWGYLEAKVEDFMDTEKSSFKWFLKMITFRAKLRGIPHVKLVQKIITSATVKP
ncbi:MAG: hypothetical protein ACFFAH_07805 [Promethearchaeota archaeon]